MSSVNYNNNAEKDNVTKCSINDAFIDVSKNANTISAISNVIGGNRQLSETVPNCNNIELEYKNITSDRNGWQRLYQEIREKCEQEASEKHFETSESEKPQNRCLNRYRDVNPYDHSRIVIHRGSIDYINANLVQHKNAGRKYILTQGPLCDTVGHFWLMIWEQNTKAILMLNKLIEKKQIKCHMYWPAQKGVKSALQLKEVNLTVELLRYEEYTNFARRWLKLTDLESNTSREITQFHYTTWPDFGIPSSPVAFLQFLKEVRDSGALDINVGPAVVHCSAGIGRSGTFCLVDCCLVLIDKLGVSNVSVQDVLYELRKYRMGLIQTADQLYFSYQAIIEGIKLLKNPEFNDYKEEPIPHVISKNDDGSKTEEEKDLECNVDEVPPPIPPRTHSLVTSNTMGSINTYGQNYPIIDVDLMNSTHETKPLQLLPLISNSINYTTDYLNDTNDNNNDIDNNNANTTNIENRSTDSVLNRPLPALPINDHSYDHDNSFHLCNEVDSDGNDFSEDEQSDYNHDEIVDDNNENTNYNNIKINTDEHHHTENNLNDGKTVTRISDNCASSNGKSENLTKAVMQTTIDNDTPSILNCSDNTKSGNTTIINSSIALRRRLRSERQANIEQKVQEIKRKKNENERIKQAAANQRKSFIKYITAGVIVGVICVYAYSKWT